MILFATCFTVWILALIIVRHEQDNLSKDSSWGFILFMALAAAYFFWSVGWVLAYLVNLVQCRL